MSEEKIKRELRKAIQENVGVVDDYFNKKGATKEDAETCLKIIKKISNPGRIIKSKFGNKRIYDLAKTILEHLEDGLWNMAKTLEPRLYELAFLKK